jgi:acetyl esterase/lipase
MSELVAALSKPNDLHDKKGGVAMASKQLKHMAELYASIKERMAKPGIDLATSRDTVENLHLAAIEPEAVTYAEVDAGGVPALWCIPEGCDADHALLHSHSGGTVVTSMHTDRKAIGHIAKAVGVRALVLNYRRSPEHKFPAQIDDVEKAYRWLLAQGIRAENIASRQRLHRQGDPGRRRSSVERRGDEPVPHAVSYG